jgi:nitroreductase
MNFLELAKKRCSVREYDSRPVEKEKLEHVLEAARLAPSACNMQPWLFMVVQNPEILQKLYFCYEREWFRTAPACIVICGNHKISWKRKFDNKDHCDVDIAITTDHLTLAATEAGLGTCWICAFDPDKCRNALGLTDSDLEPIVIIPIGYPAKKDVWETTAKNRKKAEEIIIYK